MAEQESVRLLVTFAERGMGKTLAKLYGEQGVFFSYQCRGHGTASSELLDVLGVGSAEKDILLCLASRAVAVSLLDKLDNELQGAAAGNGIAFAVPLTGLNGFLTAVLNEQEVRTGGVKMEDKTNHSLILLAVNQGHTDAVMETARQAGAGGGTVIRARWAGTEETGEFYGISVQPEKEIIAIVASADKRNTIMEMVNKKHGLKTEAGAMICSVGIDHMVRLA